MKVTKNHHICFQSLHLHITSCVYIYQFIHIPANAGLYNMTLQKSTTVFMAEHRLDAELTGDNLIMYRYTIRAQHWNGNLVILMNFSSLAAPIVIKLTTFSSGSDENFIKIMTFTFSVSISWPFLQLKVEAMITLSDSPNWWLSAWLQYLHCVSNKDNSVLH